MRSFCSLIACFALFPFSSWSQQTDSEWIEYLQKHTETTDSEGLPTQEFLDLLQQYSENKIPLNSCSISELEEFPLLSGLQSRSLMDARNKLGRFQNWQDVLRTPQIGFEDVKMLRNFFTLEDQKIYLTSNNHDIRNISGKLYSGVGLKLNNLPNYTDYHGSNYRGFTRLNLKSQKLYQINLGIEKDAGERLFHRNKIEFITANFSLTPKSGFIKQVVVGDYFLKSGQNLVFGLPFAMGISSNPEFLHRGGSLLKPSSGFNESSFYRGIATEIKIHSISGALGFSSTRRDSYINSENMLSIAASGLHRTSSEVARKHNATHRNYNGIIQWNHSLGNIGLSFQQSGLKSREASLRGSNYSLFWNANFDSGIFFGELAVHNQGRSFNGGVLVFITKNSSLSFFARHLSSLSRNNFTSPLSALSSGSETGFLVGYKFKIHNRWNISTYMDCYKRPVAFIPDQKWNSDFQIQAEFQNAKNVSGYFRYRNRVRSSDSSSIENKSPVAYTTVKHSIRIHIEIDLSENSLFRSRIECSGMEPSQTSYLWYQEFSLPIYKAKHHLRFRLAWFKAKSYDNRIYAFESTPPLIFSIPAYYGHGNRFYLMIKSSWTKKLSTWIKYSEWVYLDRNWVEVNKKPLKTIKSPEVQVVIKYTL
ncbi:ComEA family DNA-binding protein [Luteibaculum oceani]|uniref:Helix-hairpin-helix domain-containing protein n=1 Tax=Luteibaculum oceani TaxID=1294296 RepID=A0A5C6UYF1_9FLAO|nr:helix-hairpin-helix domain-containing protein [Luteibaculum oceani]TXC78442.1 helix-hairpin-helix domain-containing protein [Luteibaculum oceani]